MRHGIALLTAFLWLSACHPSASPAAASALPGGSAPDSAVSDDVDSISFNSLALDGQGHLWGVSTPLRQIYEVSLDTGKIIARYPATGMIGPYGIVSDKRGDLWVRGASYHLMEAPVGDPHHPVLLPVNPRGLAVGPGGQAWVAVSGST